MFASNQLHLGLVTYNLASEWDVPTIIKNCQETQFAGVELRATHKHGVETALSQHRRSEIKKQFADSGVHLISLGSAFEYHAVAPAEVQKNIEGTREYVKLAADLGCEGIKVRPNGLQIKQGIPAQQTLAQISRALSECGEYAKDFGVEIRVEVHGPDTMRFPNFRQIMDNITSDNVFVCWNSNDTDLLDDGFEANFDAVADKIRIVHITELWRDYPWRRLFQRLNEINFSGYCCAEIPASPEPLRLMKYYRALFLAYQNLK